MKEHLNRIALVTGGSSGIGRGAAIELARNGSAVAIHGRDLAEAESVAQLILDFGGRAIAFAGEIQDEDQVRELVRNVVECFGGINTLVTSAGIQRYGSAVDTDVLTWDEVFNVNVKGAFLAAKYSLPYLRESPAGSIAIVASAQATAKGPWFHSPVRWPLMRVLEEFGLTQLVLGQLTLRCCGNQLSH